jgi:PTH1 family peptidyl-tRNA hydrolase
MEADQWIVLGIGNPGAEYEGTRHNVGFEVIDKVAHLFGLRFKSESDEALIAKGETSGEPILLIKPLGYVNRSGETLARLLGKDLERVEPSKLVVVVDDVALTTGALRLRASGSDGGHNGLKSLIRVLNTQEFPRLRVGIGSVPGELLRNHVLSRFLRDERPVMDASVLRAAQGLRELLEGGSFLRVQEQLNRGFLSAEERVRETGKSEAVARATPMELAANHGRIRKTGEQPVTSKLNKYEGMFLLHAGRLAESETTPVTRVTELLKRQSIEPLRIEVWDERRLAYPIEGQKRGTYVLAHFEAPGGAIANVNRDINITEDVLRALITVHPKKFPDFKTAAEMEALRPRRDDDRGSSEGGSRFGFGGGGRRARPVDTDEEEDFDGPDRRDEGKD